MPFSILTVKKISMTSVHESLELRLVRPKRIHEWTYLVISGCVSVCCNWLPDKNFGGGGYCHRNGR